MGAVVSALSVVLHPTAEGASGTAALLRPATVRMNDHETSITADTHIAWNGARLSFDSLRLAGPEATLVASGAAALLGTGPPIAIDASGSADLDRLSAWFGVGDRPIGRMAVRA